VLEGEASAGQPASAAAFALREISESGVRQFRLHAELHKGCIGAPVFSEKGESIGLLTGVVAQSGNEAFHFLPSSRIRAFLQDMRLYGRLVDRWIGLKFEEAQGVPVVVGISPGSPAATAEFEAGDVICEVAGVSVQTLQDLVEIMPALPLDEEANIRVLRGRDLKTLRVTPRRKVLQIH
jgi:S1-C subfamily serine protease